MDSKAIGNDVGYDKGQNRISVKINYLIKGGCAGRIVRTHPLFI